MGDITPAVGRGAALLYVYIGTLRLYPNIPCQLQKLR